MATRFRTARPFGGGAAASGDAEAAFEQFRVHMEPRFDEVEKLRLRMKDEYTMRLMVAGTATISLLLLSFLVRTLIEGGATADDESLQVFIGLPLIIGVVLFLWAQGPRNRYARRYKEMILPEVAGFFGEFQYAAKDGIGMERLEPSTIVPSHDRYHHEDMFHGSYKDVGVEFCEARLTERRGSGKNRRTVTVFDGVFVLLTMNKSFRGKTVVRRDEGKIGNWLRDRFDGGLEPVKLEDPGFERKFEVYSTDQVEARYLLTPAFMERLLELADTVGSNRFQAAFFGARLMVMVPTTRRAMTRLPAGGLSLGEVTVGGLTLGTGGSGGLFEPGSIFRSVRASDDFHRLFHEFKAIVDIVDILKLNEDTGL